MLSGCSGPACAPTRKLEAEGVNKKPDIVSLKWVIGLMKDQADTAEEALVEYGNDQTRKQALLRCMWSVHQITSTLKALGMRKAELLTLEMERSLNYLYKDKLAPERAKLALGGVMQGLKLVPAYLEHTENERLDSGRGLERYVNDMRRWIGEKPKPPAFFFHMEVDPATGISNDAIPTQDDEIISRANIMLAPYLEMAKQGLKRRDVAQSMKTVARIARKMQLLFVGKPTERFWFAMVGLCEGMAGGLITPDECIAQIFKAGAFSIKYARENGSAVDQSIDYDSYLLQMLYYAAACEASPVHITAVRKTFGLDSGTLEEANRGLVHNDAIEIALRGAFDQLSGVVEFLHGNDLFDIARFEKNARDTTPLDAIEAAQYRLLAAGQLEQADALNKVQEHLRRFYADNSRAALERLPATTSELTEGVVSVMRDLEHMLKHGLSSACSGEQIELRESVASATFRQMGLVENQLHQILRIKSLRNALAEKPADAQGVLALTTALQRFLNKSDQDHEELRDVIRDADSGHADIGRLYSLAEQFFEQIEALSEQDALQDSVLILEEISGALAFSGMVREGEVMEQCRLWLFAAAQEGQVREDEAFRCFADAFAHIEMHLQRSLLDPLDDTSHMMAIAEQRAAQLGEWIDRLGSDAPAQLIEMPAPATISPVRGVPNGRSSKKADIEDGDISPEFREVFMEESEEIVEKLKHLLPTWLEQPEGNETLREMRRHFHTFKGNGRAVGANVLGELGWAVQDMLDSVLEGELVINESIKSQLGEVITALPTLLSSYCESEEADLTKVRELTQSCFAMARGEPISAGSNVADMGSTASNEELAVPLSATEPLAH
ncbi:MAG: hypothetical protein ACI9NT_000259 [Bacteroidia bacterium]|jgi:hypothetical protein